jgi:hypothetical protein
MQSKSSIRSRLRLGARQNVLELLGAHLDTIAPHIGTSCPKIPDDGSYKSENDWPSLAYTSASREGFRDRGSGPPAPCSDPGDERRQTSAAHRASNIAKDVISVPSSTFAACGFRFS